MITCSSGNADTGVMNACAGGSVGEAGTLNHICRVYTGNASRSRGEGAGMKDSSGRAKVIISGNGLLSVVCASRCGTHGAEGGHNVK